MRSTKVDEKKCVREYQARNFISFESTCISFIRHSFHFVYNYTIKPRVVCLFIINILKVHRFISSSSAAGKHDENVVCIPPTFKSFVQNDWRELTRPSSLSASLTPFSTSPLNQVHFCRSSWGGSNCQESCVIFMSISHASQLNAKLSSHRLLPLHLYYGLKVQLQDPEIELITDMWTQPSLRWVTFEHARLARDWFDSTIISRWREKNLIRTT